MKPAAFVGHGVTSVLQVHADAGDALKVIRDVAVTTALDHAPHEEALAGKQFLGQLHGRGCFIRLRAAGAESDRPVGGRFAVRADRDFDNVADRRILADREIADGECQRAPVRRDRRVGGRVAIQAGRAVDVAEAGRQYIVNLDSGDRIAGIGVLNAQRELNEVAGTGDCRGGGLLQKQILTDRVERHIEIDREIRIHNERVTKRAAA